MEETNEEGGAKKRVVRLKRECYQEKEELLAFLFQFLTEFFHSRTINHLFASTDTKVPRKTRRRGREARAARG